MKTQEEIEQLSQENYPIELWGEKESITRRLAFEDGYTQCQNDILQDQIVTRFEVIDKHGRVYVAKDCKVEFSYQDDGRTLKVFIKKKTTKNK